MDPVAVVPIQKSQWAVVEVKRKRDVAKLLDQEVVFDPFKSVLILFRTPALKPTEARVFEVTNVKFQEDLLDLQKSLVEAGALIIAQSPATNEWTSTYVERVIWKIKAPTSTWQTPSKAVTKQHTTLVIKNAPICAICQSDDHHSSKCEWKAILPSISVRSRGKV